MPGLDPSHWLQRFSIDEWLAAARGELAHCEATLLRRAVRPGVTHARRAAGMALNAVLVLRPNDAWGRSYMDHVVALCDDAGTPEDVRLAARQLRDTPPLPPALVTLGKPDLRVLEAARAIVHFCDERVSALRSAGS